MNSSTPGGEGVNPPPQLSSSNSVFSDIRVMGYNADLGPGLHELTREVPVAYHCGVEGCGGELGTQNPDTVLYWNHGTCVSQDTCLSVTLYSHAQMSMFDSSSKQAYCLRRCSSHLFLPSFPRIRCVFLVRLSEYRAPVEKYSVADQDATICCSVFQM